MVSNFSSIENFLRRAKRNADASKKLASNWLFSKGSATEVGALQVQKWTTWDKPRLPSSVGDQLGKDCTNGFNVAAAEQRCR
jgi:hypothetical protein